MVFDNISPRHIWIWEAVHAWILSAVTSLKKKLGRTQCSCGRNHDSFLQVSQQIDTLISFNFNLCLFTYLSVQFCPYIVNQHYVDKSQWNFLKKHDVSHPTLHEPFPNVPVTINISVLRCHCPYKNKVPGLPFISQGSPQVFFPNCGAFWTPICWCLAEARLMEKSISDCFFTWCLSWI